MHNKIKILNKAFSLTGNSYASSHLNKLYKFSEYNTDDEELLDILINDERSDSYPGWRGACEGCDRCDKEVRGISDTRSCRPQT